MNRRHPNAQTLRTVYADFSCVDRYCHDDVVLHAADAGAAGGPALIVGKQAVLEHELGLIRQFGLVMEVEDVVANDYFGAVIGNLHMHHKGKELVMPFCGLWRFHEGRFTEHWENAYDVAAIGRFMSV